MKMMKLFTSGVILLIPYTGFALSSDQTTKDRMKSDIDFIHNTFEVYYAPKEWKSSYAGWDLETETNNAKDKIQNTDRITVKKYQKIVKEFFQATKDYHVNITFYSTETARLPFSVQGANGKYYIYFVDKSRMPGNVVLNVGDEILSFNGTPIGTSIQEIMADETSHANEATDHAMAAYYLTHRLAALGHTVPQGTVSIEVKPKQSKQIKKYSLEWAYKPEKITNGFQGTLTQTEEDELLSKQKYFDKKMLSPVYDVLNQAAKKASQEDEEYFLGSRQSYIPQLGTKIWWKTEASNPFHAYLYQAPDGKWIGYVRIPHYSAGNKEFEKFADIISYMQKNSSALVIDQVDNPGGSVSYLFNLLSVLTDKPLIPPTEKMMITQEEVDNAISMVDLLQLVVENPELIEVIKKYGYDLPMTLEQMPFYLNYYNFIISEWNAGRSFTNPSYILGFDKIPPHPKVRYTKPILLLTNSLDFSGGDFFPAILQDNKRATILGTRTAGASGYVLNAKFPNKFGIRHFTYTASIAERVNKNPIENLGVTPDIEYTLTEEDFQNNFHSYVEAIHTAVSNLTTVNK